MKKSLASIERRFLEHFWFSGDYAIWSDGRVSVTGDCQLKAGGMAMKKLPVRFREVGGIFKADGAGLTSLEGFPERIGGDCICPNNPLVSLGATKLFVGGDLYLQGHQIGDAFWKKFEHAASVGGSIFCSVQNLRCIDEIAGVASQVGEEKFFEESRDHLPILRCFNRRIGIFGVPKKICEVMKLIIEDDRQGPRFGKVAMLRAAVRLIQSDLRMHAKY